MAAPEPRTVDGLPAPRLELRGITRRYGAIVANRGIDLCVQPGEIHAILGENGSGKSTLLRCIYGVESPDAGTILWDGHTVRPRGPADARALGMALVFQHFALIDALTVLDNVVLYLQGSDLQAIGAAEISRRLLALSLELDLPIDPTARIDDLSVGERQRVEILRSLLRTPRLLMLDEPTSALTPAEVEPLFRVLRRIADTGCSVLLVTHRLAEVRALCQHATILRNGQVVGHCDPGAVSEAELARWLVGETPPTLPVARATTADRVRLRIEGLSAEADARSGRRSEPLDLSVRGGEIVGIAGIAGNGQDLLLALISGEQSAASGRIYIDDADVTAEGPRRRQNVGLQVIPAERKRRGAIPALSLVANLLLTQVGRYAGHEAGSCSRLDHAAAWRDSAMILREHDVRAPGPGTPAGRLSGGNLQRFLIGRALWSRPGVLVCQNPTWGVDIRSTAAIHHRLLDARNAGTAILLISADLDELYHLADRMAVLHRGSLSRPEPTGELSRTQVGLLMSGAGAS